VRRRFIDGYGLCPLICGSQNSGFRGGTENVPAIAAALCAFRYTVKDRVRKTAHMLAMRALLRAELARRLPCFYIDEFPASAAVGQTAPRPAVSAATAAAVQRAMQTPPVVFWVAPHDERLVLPNTLMLIVYRVGLCNERVRAELERLGVLVGLGSACNAASGSSVAGALGIPKSLHGGILRLSMLDSICAEEIELAAKKIAAVVRSAAVLVG
jgi:cysteine sulfinate desulfinase/cysteine desulfurase-like protein